MPVPSLRRWAGLTIPVSMVVVGLTLRLVGLLPGWSALLILGGVIGGVLVAYVILLGGHDRPTVTDHAREELRIHRLPGSSQDLRFPNRHDRGYDGR